MVKRYDVIVSRILGTIVTIDDPHPLESPHHELTQILQEIDSKSPSAIFVFQGANIFGSGDDVQLIPLADKTLEVVVNGSKIENISQGYKRVDIDKTEFK